MKFYLLHNEGWNVLEVYVNRDDFEENVAEAVDQARYGTPEDEHAEIERRVRARARTYASLPEIESLIRNEDGLETWTEGGRSHDGEQETWNAAEVQIGNAYLYRLAADSLRKAGDETLGYNQGFFHALGVTEALCLDNVEPEQRTVSDAMAKTIAPCETAACVAAHVYICAKGWRAYLQASTRTPIAMPTATIGYHAAAELGMLTTQRAALFPAQPAIHEITDAFALKPSDWPCDSTRVESIAKRWEDDLACKADEMATVLEAIARRCDRVNALVATIDN